jgi:hypothetical protein
MGNACGGPVDCTGGVAPGHPPTLDRCTILCRDGNSCLGAVTAVARTVDITCGGDNACKVGPECSGDTCDLACNTPKACSAPACCATTCTGDGGRVATCP